MVPRFLFCGRRASYPPLASLRALLVLVSCLLKPALADDLDHRAWDALLARYVYLEGRVDYPGLKEDSLPKLDAYLALLAAPWPGEMTPDAKKAALINAYNALTVRWIIGRLPVASIQATREPFTSARHRLNGERWSLDQVEQRLRETGDPRIHAAVVCAARSCPPLRGEAYVAARLDQQLDDNTRKWLANPALHQFDSATRVARVSPILKWYMADFGGEDGLRAFLAKHAPADQAGFLARAGARIEYQDYDWGLNQADAAAPAYPRWRLYLDVVRNHRFFPAAVVISAGLVGWPVSRRLRRRKSSRPARRGR